MLLRFATLPDSGNPYLENRQNAIRTCLLLFLRRVFAKFALKILQHVRQVMYLNCQGCFFHCCGIGVQRGQAYLFSPVFENDPFHISSDAVNHEFKAGGSAFGITTKKSSGLDLQQVGATNLKKRKLFSV